MTRGRLNPTAGHEEGDPLPEEPTVDTSRDQFLEIALLVVSLGPEIRLKGLKSL
jgi:hypothetical protein